MIELIKDTDFLPYRAIANNMDVAKRLVPHIIEAQTLDVMPLMGSALWFDLMKYTASLAAGIAAAAIAEPPTTYVPTAEETKFNRLLNGFTYTVFAGKPNELTKGYEGLKPVLVYFAYSRFVLRDNIRSTPSGFTQKTTIESQPVGVKQLNDEANRAISAANTYYQHVNTYIKDQINVVDGDDFKKYSNGNDCCCGPGFVGSGFYYGHDGAGCNTGKRGKSGIGSVRNRNKLSDRFNRNER